MSNEANDLIERAEALAGCRWDDESGLGLAAILGAVARAAGKNPHPHRDDIAAGMLIREQMTERYQREQASKEMMATLLSAGVSPDDLGALLGKK